MLAQLNQQFKNLIEKKLENNCQRYCEQKIMVVNYVTHLNENSSLTREIESLN